MDNVPAQKSRVVQEASDNVGHTWLQLPTYSLQLNAAEWVFSGVVTHVRRQDIDALYPYQLWNSTNHPEMVMG
jgi:hypothetical protein